MRSRTLISASSKAGCHAVLASLSRRYPPLEGRSPTCYSPVCHSTHPLRDFRVRLACVRHAASVDSEPGSNSHVKFVGRLRAGLRRRSGERNWLTRGRFIGSALFNPLYVSGSPPVAVARTDNLGRPIARRHPLTLIVRLRSLARASSRRVVCACTLYLVFKEPTSAPDHNYRPTTDGAPSAPAAPLRPRLLSRTRDQQARAAAIRGTFKGY